MTEESLKPGEFTQEIRDIKNQLEVVDSERYQGVIVRTRSEKLWLGEQPTKRALSEENGFAKRNKIKKICYENTVTRDKKTVERAFVEHYRDLLERLAPIDEGFEIEFFSLVPQLEKSLCNRLEEPISVWELEKAIDGS